MSDLIRSIFLSSTGEGLAKRWESLFTGAIPTIVLLSTTFHWGIAEADLTDLKGQLIVVVSSAIALWKGIEQIAGWVRRFAFKREGLGKFAQ